MEDIRYVRHSQLAHLMGIDPSNFAAWNSRRKISERSLERIAEHLGINKPDLLREFELRWQDAARARAVQAKADQLIEFLNLKESA